MSELENALRNALAKGDAANPAFRQRVYQAAAGALERTLNARNADAAHVADQKRRLAEAIRAAEATYGNEPAPEPDAETERALTPKAPRPGSRVEPTLDTPGPMASPVATPDVAPRDLRAEPRSGPPLVEPRDAVRPERDERNRKRSTARRAPLALALVVIVLLGIVSAGVWWVMSTGAFQSAAKRDTSVPNPPRQLESESFDGNAGKGSMEPKTLGSPSSNEVGWITLFDPSDPTTLSLEGNASAAVDGDVSGKYALITSPDAASRIAVDVPPGTLETLNGRMVQFSISARSGDEKPTEMSVTCELGNLGGCGRLRFTATQAQNEFLFRAELPKVDSVTGPGRILITTDIGTGGKAVKLASVRVRPFNPNSSN